VRRAGNELPLPMALRIVADVLGALDYAHRLVDFDGTPLRVVHRDVGPQNVFWTYDGELKLVDFGVAKFAHGRGETEVEMSAMRNVRRVMLGGRWVEGEAGNGPAGE
jgi:serine/threonine protein kinase